MGPTRVLVVEDSITVRRSIVDVLNADPELSVVGEAEDGKSAIDLCKSLCPDVITLDMMLPIMSGLAATEYIMAHCPTPIVIVSSSTNRGDLFNTYDALGAGAVEVFEKQTGDRADDEWAEKLRSTVKLVSRIKVITHPRGRLGHRSEHVVPPTVSTEPGARPPCRAIALGASTGGPGAIVEILRGLPRDFPVPILIVLHIGQPFAAEFAAWLDGQSPIRVRYAEDGEPLPETGKGGALMAPPGRHLVLRAGKLRLTEDAARHSCRPSVDVLFESVARELGERSVAGLLTGMGRDGAKGLLAIRRAGGLTFAQDEESSVVFGMPCEAILIGAAESILPLDRFAPTFAALGSGKDARRRQ